METACLSSIFRGVTGQMCIWRKIRPVTRAGHMAALVSGLRMVALALFVVPALAGAQTNPRLASLHIQIWPEYDRQATLIILNGELAPDTPLPADVSLRIPASSGGPSAVAFANAAGSQLFNLQHKVTKTGDYSTLQFAAPQRFFHVEYYDALATGSPGRAYTYVWPGEPVASAS